MLDGWARRRIDPALDRVGAALARRGVAADLVTFAAALLGLAAAALVAFGLVWAALAAMLASRLLDGLDGAIARHAAPTDLGGYLDIVLDFLFYGAFPLGFVLLDPAANAVAGAVLLLSFYVNGASFLAFAAIAEKRGLAREARGRRSFLFTTGLAEATETILFFAAFCLFPAWFAVLACVFAAATFWTAGTRVILAWRTFRP
jgi:phosphatidylglycerophosphate synthase